MFLKQLPMFRSLPEWSARALTKAGKSVIFQQGQDITSPEGLILIVLEGEVSCFIRDAAEKKFLLGVSGAGDVLGELSFLVPEGGNDQKVFLQATSQVKTLQVPAQLFFDTILQDNLATTSLLTVVARRLSAMNRFARQVVDIDIDPTKIERRTLAEYIADWISEKIGSWRFIAVGALLTIIWMLLNAGALYFTWDPYPYIFLNLIFSVMSAATMPVLLMSQNRQNQLDRLAARVNHRITLRGSQLLGRVLKELRQLREEVRKRPAEDDTHV